MDNGIERRSSADPRVPLDLLVELNHEDFDGSFDADSVDISRGGVALRCDYLPEIGDRLACNFDNPLTGDRLSIDGEVVWTCDNGYRRGEFGVRFRQIESDADENLRQIINTIRSTTPSVLGPINLHLEGVATPIDGEILERSESGIKVEQELTFLRLGMGVVIEPSLDKNQGTLTSVDVRFEGDTPRLVLEVQYTPPASSDIRKTEGQSEDTLHDVVLGESDDCDQAHIATHEWKPATSREDSNPDTLDDINAPIESNELTNSDKAMLAHQASVQLTGAMQGPVDRNAVTEAPERPIQEGESESALLDEELRSFDQLHIFKSRLTKLMEQIQNGSRQAHRQLGPQAQKLGQKTKEGFAAASAKTLPMLKKFHGQFMIILAATWTLLKKQAAKHTRRKTSSPRRRTTPPQTRRQQHADKSVAVAPKRRGLGLFVLAAAIVGSTWYAFSSESTESTTVETVAAETSSIAPPATTETSLVAPAPLQETREASPEPTPSAPETAEPVTASDNTTATPSGGPLAVPAYPSLRATQTDENSTNTDVEEGTSFGSDTVPNARRRTIRMSQPVTTLRGQRRDDGFSVTIPGALALDRAGPLAASNPSVERAMILNRGDHSVLTIRFVAGRSPLYRVSAQGRAIEVSIGR